MPTHLWRIVVLGVLGAAAAFAVLYAERPLLAIAGFVGIVGLHAIILGVEFALAAAKPGDSKAPPAGPLQRWLAWWEEVRVDARMFGWEQAFRRGRHPAARLHPRGRRGLVLVPGFLCNRAVWHPWIDRLDRRTPYATVETRALLRPIDDGIDALESAVHAVEAATGMTPLIVAHSMGGLLVRAWLDARTADKRIHRVVTVATPHAGTRFAHAGFGSNVRQMQLGSAWLASLRQREPTLRAARFVCFYGHCDNVVVPASSGMLAGADNRHLPGAAHLAMLYRPEVFTEVVRCLEAPDDDVTRTDQPPAGARADADWPPAGTSGSDSTCTHCRSRI